MTQTAVRPAEVEAQRRAKYLAGLLWHAGTFVIINVFFWMLDMAGAGGVNWAFWITVAWGFALAFHGLAYYVDGRNVEAMKTREYLEAERRR